MPRSRDELLAALAADEWLRAGDVATVLDVSRSTASRLFDSGELAYRYRPGGKQRTADPADVRRLLEASERTHRGEAPQD
ncbi:helix-turn-helix domain-containing protein [Actinoplanes missouriensis]|nr:helix-turn-helix domain-containing protein [Actinoplanes missouriensis]